MSTVEITEISNGVATVYRTKEEFARNRKAFDGSVRVVDSFHLRLSAALKVEGAFPHHFDSS